jgi:asparagine synthase (glutamine-hydrolysing)
MCGIAGVIGFQGSRDGVQPISTFYRALEHRGPDDRGCLVFHGKSLSVGREAPTDVPLGATLLIHRRLSILDLSDAGWQPMGTADGRYYVILNGEIYNYLELRRDLKAAGHTFRSHGDTEVLLSAYAEWGPACLSRLVGMFAFAILDTVERRLFIARDPFGIKPLYYASAGDETVFASEVAALLAYPRVDRRIDPRRAYLYLRYGVTDHGDGTLLSEIHQLEAAHYMEIPLDDHRLLQPKRYWTLSNGGVVQDISFDEAARKVRDLFLKSVQLHLRSDVPVGTALSGGIDSSAIVAAMRHVGGGTLALHTFSYISDDPAFSEERWVNVATSSTNANVHKVQSSASELREHLTSLIRSQGEPFGSTSIFAQHLVFREASQNGIKVMLDGQGADEILAGYRPYLGARVASLIRSGRWIEAGRFSAMASRLPGMKTSSVTALVAAAMLPPRLQAPLRRVLGREAMPRWLNRKWLRDHGVEQQVYGHTRDRRALMEELRSSIDTSSLPHLLRYEDRNSMAFSIESRVPFLTTEFVEFILSLPEEYILAPDGTSKAVFRAAMRGIVPDEILDRRDKIAFVTPEAAWLAKSADWVASVLGDDEAAASSILDLEEVRREADRLLAGVATGPASVWRCLNLIAWIREFQTKWDD